MLATLQPAEWHYIPVIGGSHRHLVKRVYELLPWNLAGVRQRLDLRDAA